MPYMKKQPARTSTARSRMLAVKGGGRVTAAPKLSDKPKSGASSKKAGAKKPTPKIPARPGVARKKPPAMTTNFIKRSR